MLQCQHDTPTNPHSRAGQPYESAFGLTVTGWGHCAPADFALSSGRALKACGARSVCHARLPALWTWTALQCGLTGPQGCVLSAYGPALPWFDNASAIWGVDRYREQGTSAMFRFPAATGTAFSVWYWPLAWKYTRWRVCRCGWGYVACSIAVRQDSTRW